MQCHARLETLVREGPAHPDCCLSILPLPATPYISSSRIWPFLSHTGYLPPPTLPQGVRKADTVANQVPTIPVLSLKTLAGPYLACSALPSSQIGK